MCVRGGTWRGGHSQGPHCLVAQRSAEYTTKRISEIKECDRDGRKKRTMTEKGTGQVTVIKRERRVKAVLYYLQLKAFWMLNACVMLQERERRGEVGATKLQMS